MGLIYGKNPVQEAVLSGKTINKIYFQKGNREIYDIVKLANDNKVITVVAEKSKLDRMISEEGKSLKNSQGIVASITDFVYSNIDDILDEANNKNEAPFVVILDKIEDPHNLGAIIRSAHLLGAHGIIIQKRNASQVTDTVEKVAAGACAYLKVARVTNITESIKYLKEKGLWIYGLDMLGESNIFDTKISGAVGIVVGNEGAGISRLVRENCDVLVKIPMFGKIDSLNASVSTAICLYEVVRQKMKGSN